MADFSYPPLEPDPTPEPLSPSVPYNPPMVGELNPFEMVHGGNRDSIVAGMREWMRTNLLTWSKSWQTYLTGWVSTAGAWLDGFNTAVQAYVTDTLAAQATDNQVALDAALDDVAAAVDTILDASIAKNRRVHVVACDGQSNMSGRGTPFGDAYAPGADAAHPRIFQFPGRGASNHAFVPAVEPLTMADTASGMGPALQFARNWIADLPEDDIIVLVPNAYGGTPLSSDAALAWRWGIAGNLSAKAVALTKDAITAAASQWPTSIVELSAVLFFQGETDGTNNVPFGTYRTDLDALIAGYRASYGIPTLPFIVFAMIPEAVAASAARQNIAAVHRDTPYRVANTGYVENLTAGLSQGDGLHANAKAQREIYGPGAYAEYRRLAGKRAPTSAREVAPVPSTYIEVLAADGFTRTDGPAVATSTGSLAYGTVSSDGTSHPVLGVVSNAAKFTSGIPATLSLQHYWWADNGSRSSQQRNLSVVSAVATNPGVAIQLDPTNPGLNRIVLARQAADQAFWRIVSNDNSATAVSIDTGIPMTGALQKITAERFDIYWRIWIDNVYAGRVPVIANGTAFGGYAGSSTSAGTPQAGNIVWDSLQLWLV